MAITSPFFQVGFGRWSVQVEELGEQNGARVLGGCLSHNRHVPVGVVQGEPSRQPSCLAYSLGVTDHDVGPGPESDDSRLGCVARSGR
jgi:hypothetical protein